MQALYAAFDSVAEFACVDRLMHGAFVGGLAKPFVGFYFACHMRHQSRQSLAGVQSR